MTGAAHLFEMPDRGGFVKPITYQRCVPRRRAYWRVWAFVRWFLYEIQPYGSFPGKDVLDTGADGRTLTHAGACCVDGS